LVLPAIPLGSVGVGRLSPAPITVSGPYEGAVLTPALASARRERGGRVMPLIQLVVVLIVVGVLLWLVNNYIPMDAKIKNILNIVVVIAVVLWLLNVFGVLSGLSGLRVGP
jgi:hypothetical protein